MPKKKTDSTPIAEIMEHLAPIASLLTSVQVDELKEQLSVRHFKKNQIIYKEGDVPQYFHCLVSGKVKIYKDGVSGRTQIMRVIKPVEFFGFRAYFANENYVTAAAAFEASTLCLIPMQLVDQWTKTNLQLAHFFIRHLSIELGSSDQRTVNLTQKHIRGRLAEALLFLRDSYGLEADGATLSIYMSREDLANLSNMTTSNAIRTLSAFANERIVAIDGRKIKLIDEEQIKRISKIG